MRRLGWFLILLLFAGCSAADSFRQSVVPSAATPNQEDRYPSNFD